MLIEVGVQKNIQLFKASTSRDPLYQHIEAKTKWATFHRQYFQMYFLEWRSMNFD